MQLTRKPLAIPAAGAPWFGAENQMSGMLDPSDQAKGWLTAFDAETGRVRWKYAAPRPVLAGVTPTGGGIVTYRAGGEQLVAVASGMKSPVWPGGADQSRVLVFGLR